MRVTGLLCAGLLLAGLAQGQEAGGSHEPHPLEPVDTRSPRDTVRTFLHSIERAWELYAAGDPAFREHLRDSIRCLDLSEVPPEIAEGTGVDTALILKEILDRIELPPPDAIPSRERVAAEGLTRWTVPHTEIELHRVAEGRREGEFLFTPETVARGREFYERVRQLPYRPGKGGAHYDELRFGADSRFAATVVSRLPPWMKAEYQGLLGWQWVVLALLVLLSIALVVFGFIVGRRLAASRHGLLAFVGPFVAPLVMISLQWIIPPLAPWPTQLGGPGVRVVALGLVVLAYLGVAWLVAVAFGKLASLVIRASGAEERPLHRQLILVVSRIASVLAITLVLFEGGQALGIPVSALVTGLGVGGLAVALSAQSTLENLLGGINLFADRPVQIGDFCKFGEELGVVEAIGLRSTRIRTLGRTVISIPNSSFAKMPLENLSRRDRNLLRTRLRLNYGVGAEEVETVLSELRETLAADERVAAEPFRIRLLDLGRDAIEIEIFVYVLTTDWDEYLGIREELLLEAMRTVDAAGLRLAVPTERHEIVQTPVEQP